MIDKITNNQELSMYNHLLSRGMAPESYNGIMIFEDVVIFTLWNLSGQMVGYQQYRPGASKERKNDPREGRYYTSLHGDKNEKPIGVWGLESLSLDPHVLVIVEGIFDACQIHRLGVPCVALLNSSYKHYKNWLTCLGRKIYKIEDSNGSKLGPYTNIELPEGKDDVGECDKFEVFDMLCKNINLLQLHSIMGFWTTDFEESSQHTKKKYYAGDVRVDLDGADFTSMLTSPSEFVSLNKELNGRLAASFNVPVEFLTHPDYQLDIEKDIIEQIVKDVKNGL